MLENARLDFQFLFTAMIKRAGCFRIGRNWNRLERYGTKTVVPVHQLPCNRCLRRSDANTAKADGGNDTTVLGICHLKLAIMGRNDSSHQ